MIKMQDAADRALWHTDLLEQQEDGRFFMQVVFRLAPLANGQGADVFVFATDIRRYTKAGLRTAAPYQILYQFVVAVRCFYEYLGCLLYTSPSPRDTR